MYLDSGRWVYGGPDAHDGVGGPRDNEGHHVDHRHLQGLHYGLLGSVHPARALAGLAPPVHGGLPHHGDQPPQQDVDHDVGGHQDDQGHEEDLGVEHSMIYVSPARGPGREGGGGGEGESSLNIAWSRLSSFDLNCSLSSSLTTNPTCFFL